MASAFDVARRLASAGMGQVERAYEPLDQPGPDFAVSPFQPGTVSTAAGVVKALTAIGASRRLQANADQVRRDKALGAQKDQAELARIQAQTSYYNQRASATPAAAKSTRMAFLPNAPWAKHLATAKKEADGTYSAELKDIDNAQQTWNGERSGARGARTAQARSKVTAAKASMAMLDQSLKAKADQKAADMYNSLIADKDMLANGTPQQKVIAARHLGIDPESPDPFRDADDRIRAKVEETRTFHYNALRRGSDREFAKLRAMVDSEIFDAVGGGPDPAEAIKAIMDEPDDEE